MFAADQAVVERRRRRVGMRQNREDLVPQSCCLFARDHAELVTQGAVHTLVLAERGSPIAAGDVRVHQCDVRFLVGRLFGEECVPALRAAKERDVEAASVFAARLGPRLVGVGWQERSAVAVECVGERAGVVTVQGAIGERFEVDHVDRDVAGGEERDLVASQNDRFAVAERLAGIVRGLVEPRPGFVDGKLGPDRIEALLAVQASPRRKGEELDEARRVAALPARADRRQSRRRARRSPPGA